MKPDVENLMRQRWTGVALAVLIIMSLGLPWAYPEDFGNTMPTFGMFFIAAGDLQEFGYYMGFLMTGIMLVASGVYLWKRWRKMQGVKTAITRFAVVALYPILAAGSLEKIGLGYLTTLLLCAPVPALMFVNFAHRKLEPRGGIQAVARSIYSRVNRRDGRLNRTTDNATQP